MRNKFWILASLVLSAPALAGSLAIKPEVIYSTSQLKIGDEKSVSPDGERVSTDVANTRFIKGYGGALDLEYGLNDRWRVGGGVGYVSYNQQHGSNQPQFNDLFAKAQLSYDFLKVGELSTYAAGGLSYHMVDLNSERQNGTFINPGEAQLWNWDAGLGARLQASDSVSFGLEYRLTSTIDTDKIRVKYAAADRSARSELTKVKLNTNEVLTSLTYVF